MNLDQTDLANLRRIVQEEVARGRSPSGPGSKLTLLYTNLYVTNNLPLITPFHPDSIGTFIAAFAAAAPASTTWGTANTALFFPFLVRNKPITVRHMFVVNGTAVSGNFDIGVYDADGVLKVSSGATAQSGTNAVQQVNVTDTELAPGLYYLTLAFDNTTATVQSTDFGSIIYHRAAGVLAKTSAYPLPTPVTTWTGGGAADRRIPLFGLAVHDDY